MINHLIALADMSKRNWWRFAAAAAVLALFAFPVYKGVIVGLVPVVVGVGIMVLIPMLPRTLLVGIDRAIVHPSRRRWIGWILLVAVLMRLPAVLFPPIPVSDHAAYWDSGMRLAAGGGFGNLILWPPGPAATVALGMLAVGDGNVALAAFFAVLGVVAALGVYLATCGESETAARWGSLAAAVFPSIVLWNTTPGHETTVTLLFAVVVALVFRIVRDNRWQWGATAILGVTLGILALVRPTAIAIPALLAATLFLRRRSLLHSLAKPAVVAVLMLAVIAPWTYRNYVKFGEFCLISANAGKVLLSSNHPESDGIYHTLPHLDHLKPCERDRERGRQARAAIAADPVRFLALSVKRIVFMWGTDTSGLDFVLGEPPRGGALVKAALSAILQIPWAMLVTAWAIAAWYDKRHLTLPVDWTFVVLWVALLWLTHAVVEPLSRHHLPLIPFMAAIVVPPYWSWVMQRLDKKRSKEGIGDRP